MPSHKYIELSHDQTKLVPKWVSIHLSGIEPSFVWLEVIKCFDMYISDAVVE